jgi:glycosyltransferase involved in cell wall biosynthesis
MIPLVRAVAPRARIVTNIDGLEWKRRKWGYLARAFLRLSERAAVRFSNAVIADNRGIADYIQETYGSVACRIPYGGDACPRSTLDGVAECRGLRFAAGSYYVAVCRIEPENSVAELLDAFATNQSVNIVVVGNWSVSRYSRKLGARHSGRPNIDLLDPVYDRHLLDEIRGGAKAYVHGHTAGGTNPSLVEAMSLGLAVLAYDVNYNRFTTNNQAAYWTTPSELADLVSSLSDSDLARNASAMLEYARQHYTWAKVSSAYFDVIFPGGRGLT